MLQKPTTGADLDFGDWGFVGVEAVVVGSVKQTGDNAYDLQFLPVIGRGGKPQSVIAVFADVTSRYTSLVQIPDREEFLQGIIDTVVDGIAQQVHQRIGELVQYVTIEQQVLAEDAGQDERARGAVEQLQAGEAISASGDAKSR